MRVHEVKFHLVSAKNAFSHGIFSLKQKLPNYLPQSLHLSLFNFHLITIISRLFQNSNMNYGHIRIFFVLYFNFNVYHVNNRVKSLWLLIHLMIHFFHKLEYIDFLSFYSKVLRSHLVLHFLQLVQKILALAPGS